MSEFFIQLHWQRAEEALKPAWHETIPDPV